MVARLGFVSAGQQNVRAIAIHSRAALDRPLRLPAELWVAVACDEGLLLGAFQRSAGLVTEGRPVGRRGSGGPEVIVGQGTVYVGLSLAQPGALVACDEKRIVNRAVRPLLRALSASLGAGNQAHYFGRDWISVGNRPAGWVGFAHDATTRRTLFEAFIAVRAPFATAQRPSFRNRRPGTLESIGGHPFDPASLANAIIAAYATVAESEVLEGREAADDDIAPRGAFDTDDPPWTATCEEAIGTLGAGPDARGVLRIGGDLLVSRDALSRLETRAAQSSDDDLGRVVDETLAVPGIALDGIRSLASVRDVIIRARRG
ncbi:MAG: hypothetical protein M3O46_02305 [Myxococcota bacterium]|nr:hypothetical protein [Myxococcota bacterium]